MQKHILALLLLFQGRVPDETTNDWLYKLAVDPRQWHRAHDIFDKVRRRNLAAIAKKDSLRECQYCFEEVCLKALFNESGSRAPFDPDSPYWIVPNAIELARAIGIPAEAVIDIITPVRRFDSSE